MRKIIVYTQSLNHLNQRIFIARINIDGDISEDIKLLNKAEISEEDIAEINNIIKVFSPEDEITIYTLTSYVDKQNNLKEKWANSNEGKELISLGSKYDIKLKKYSKENEIVRNELIKNMVSFHRGIDSTKNEAAKSNIFQKVTTSGIQQNKVYNDNNKIQSIINVFLRGGCDTSNENRDGYYIALISKGDNNKVLFERTTDTTSNRMLLTGLAEVMKVLKFPCLIRLYTHTNLGFSGGATNKDLKELLFKLMKENNHAVIEIISNKKQEYIEKLSVAGV